MTSNRTRIAWNARLGLAVAGVAVTALGPSLPALIREYGLTFTLAGTVFGFFAGGRVAAVVLSIVVAERMRRKWLLFIGNSGFAFGLIGFALSTSWPLHLFSIAVAGAGYGFTDVSANALTAELFSEQRARALNRLQAFYGVGCIVGPLITVGAISIGIGWRTVFFVAGVTASCAAVFTLVLSIPHRESTLYPSDLRIGTLFRSRVLVLAGLCVLLYTGSGNGLIGWINTYFEDVLLSSAVVATSALLAYNAGITAGRFLCGSVAEHLGYKKTIVASSAGAVLSLSVAAATSSIVLGYIAYTLTGLFFAGIAPTALAIATRHVPERTAAVSAGMFLYAAAGSLLIPFSIGAVADAAGLQAGISLVAVAVLLVLLTARAFPGP